MRQSFKQKSSNLKSYRHYILLMLVLLAVVAFASWTIMSFLRERIGGLQAQETIRDLSFAIWLLTMGTMFLTGAFGLWGMRSVAEIEGYLKVSRFITAMDYFRDGLALLDKTGRVIGYNPGIKQFFHKSVQHVEKQPLTSLFACVTASDLAALLNLKIPHEFERECFYDNQLHTLRFRSQPSSGVRLVLICDVTETRFRETRQRQLALLQLIGRIAGGMAQDFNDILCAISGHASLLERDSAGIATAESLDAIQQQTQRGALLSRQLLALSHAGERGQPGTRIELHLDDAAALLRAELNPAWEVEVNASGTFAPVALSSGQVEQIVLNLGLLAADTLACPGKLTISLAKRGSVDFNDLPESFVTCLTVTAELACEIKDSRQFDASQPLSAKVIPPVSDSGVVMSVVKSLLQEAHGVLNLRTQPERSCVYNLYFPSLALENVPQNVSIEDHPVELGSYLSGWHLLLVSTDAVRRDSLTQVLQALGIIIEQTSTLSSALEGELSLRKQDIILLDLNLCGNEDIKQIKALLEQHPHSGMIVLADDVQKTGLQDLQNEVVVIAKDALPGEVMQAFITAKAMRFLAD